MTPTRQGSFHLFRFARIDVFLHWSWFVVAIYSVQQRGESYTSLTWNVLEYLALFMIVLLHEFGHALACRQVGGEANQIVLWPLGGVAYVNPPQRPGATLWSIAAGPLVNVVLLPVLGVFWLLIQSIGWQTEMPNAYVLIQTVFMMNLGLLIFNLLPVYPLDGGQILRSLLWFVLGRARSLMAASVIGFVGVAGLATLAWVEHSVWMGIISAFIFLNCWRGFKYAQALSAADQLPRHSGFACPVCKASPPHGTFWGCNKCRTAFDTFETHSVCPKCGEQFATTRCFDCGRSSPMAEWAAVPPLPPVISVPPPIRATS
jgi:Zn-dependent protease